MYNMLSTRLNDGTPLMEHLKSLDKSFWKGTSVKNFAEFQEIISAKEKGSQTYYWIQFPKPHSLASPNLFLDKIQGLERYSWFKNYIFNIEFNPHIHSHMIILDPSKVVRPSRIISNIGQHLGIKENNIECKRYSHSYTNRYNYVKGLKIPNDKQLLVEQDKLDREKYNINTYYNDADQPDPKTQSPQT